MKTITQLKEDIANLMKASGDIDAKCISENRQMNDEEKLLKGQILDKVESIKAEVELREREERLSAALTAPEKPASQPKTKSNIEIPTDSRSKDKFPSFAAQLSAIMTAGRPGGNVDPRLFNAASGMSESVSSDGGFLVQQDFAAELLQDVFNTGMLAARCRRIQLSGNSNGIKINGIDETSRASNRYGGVLAYWIDEAAEKTATKPKFRQIELSLKKLIGLCYATDELLQDAVALEQTIRTAFAGEFGFRLDDAIVNGTGAGQPLGLLNAGSLVSVGAETGQAATTIVAENIVKMYARRFAPQTGNYAWYYNQDIEPQLYTMSLAVGTGGVPVYMPPGGLSQSPYGTLMGLPAIAIEHCATLGTQGDIILANFRDGYVLAEKGGIASDMSIHVRFIFDESTFRFVMRVDGEPVRASALTPYKGSNTQSHFIVLDTRS